MNSGIMVTTAISVGGQYIVPHCKLCFTTIPNQNSTKPALRIFCVALIYVLYWIVEIFQAKLCKIVDLRTSDESLKGTTCGRK